jgi:DNA-binding PadR family transcriptional regulator
VAFLSYIGLNSVSIYRIDISLDIFLNLGVFVRSRAETLEFTLLGLLSQSPLHGYEIRKRLSAIYGPFRALSFSVLYPQLRRMLEAGLIAESVDVTTRRSRIVYTITKAGEKKFSQLTDLVNPESWEDDGFEARFAFFGATSSNSRLRILEGRHRRLKEKAELLRSELDRDGMGLDKYLEEWRRHSLESAEREIAWLEELIHTESK